MNWLETTTYLSHDDIENAIDTISLAGNPSDADLDELTDLKEILASIGDDADRLIREDEFPDYTKEYAIDTGAILSTRASNDWPLNCIDWTEAAEELQGDFCSITIGDWEYYYQ